MLRDNKKFEFVIEVALLTMIYGSLGLLIITGATLLVEFIKAVK
jgi:hypothetical protein